MRVDEAVRSWLSYLPGAITASTSEGCCEVAARMLRDQFPANEVAEALARAGYRPEQIVDRSDELPKPLWILRLPDARTGQRMSRGINLRG